MGADPTGPLDLPLVPAQAQNCLLSSSAHKQRTEEINWRKIHVVHAFPMGCFADLAPWIHSVRRVVQILRLNPLLQT